VTGGLRLPCGYEVEQVKKRAIAKSTSSHVYPAALPENGDRREKVAYSKNAGVVKDTATLQSISLLKSVP